MKFIANKDSVSKVLSLAQEIISNKSPISILSNILLKTDKVHGKVFVKCTNLTVKCQTSFKAEIEEDGETTVYCDKMLKIVSAFPSGDILFESENNELKIKSPENKVKFKIKSLASDKFPEFDGFYGTKATEISSKALKNIITNTLHAVSSDVNRFVMTGCYLANEDDGLTMVATDGCRMSVSSCNTVSTFNPVIIPVKILAIITKILGDEGTVYINATDKEFFFKADNVELSSALIVGQYPAYKRVMPLNLDCSLLVVKQDLVNAINRAIIMIDKNNRIQLLISKNKLIVHYPESEMGSSKEELSVRYEGPDAEISLKAQYLLDALKVIDSADVNIEFKIGQDDKITSAIKVMATDGKDKSIHVIMPIIL